MKIKIALLVSFLFCYLEWGNKQSAFVFEIAYTILFEKLTAGNFFHPLVLGSFLCVCILCISLFANISLKLEKLAIILLTVLVVFFSFIGVISLQYKVILSTLPYLFLTNYYFKITKKTNKI